MLGWIVAPQIHIHLEPQNVSLFENGSVQTSLVKLRWSHNGLRWGLIHDWCPYKKREVDTEAVIHRAAEQEVHVMLEAETGDAAASPEREGCSRQPEGRRERPGLAWSLQRKHGPVNTLVSDVWPPELWEDTYLLLLSHPICGNLLGLNWKHKKKILLGEGNV